MLSLVLVSNHHHDLETRYALAYFHFFHTAFSGASLIGFFHAVQNLGLTSEGINIILATQTGIDGLSNCHLPGLPLTLRYTRQIRTCYELSTNVHHESLYSSESEGVNLDRIFTVVREFENVMVGFCQPYWNQVFEWKHVHQLLEKHLKLNVMAPTEVSYFCGFRGPWVGGGSIFCKKAWRILRRKVWGGLGSNPWSPCHPRALYL